MERSSESSSTGRIDGGTPPNRPQGERLQRALARLGLFALESVDVPALMDESLREIVRQLDVEYGLVLRMRPGDGDALMVAGAGFSEDLAHNATLPAGEGTLMHHVTDTRRPVLVEDWSAEERFEQPPLFEEYGIRRSAAVRIAGRGLACGVLCAGGTTARPFSDDEVQFLKTTATIVGRAVELREAERDRLTADQENGGKERFRTLAEAIPQQVWSATPQGHLNFVNKQVLHYMRSSSEAILEAGWFDLMHPEDREDVKAAWHEAIEMGEPFEEEFRLRRGHDGLYRWFLCRAVPMQGRDGEILQWYGTNTDITQQKEDAIEHRRLAAIVENASDFVGSFSLDGEMRFLNEAGRELVGLSGEDTARQKNFADFHTEDDADFLNERILPTVRSEGRWQGEFTLCHFGTGATIPVDADLFLTRDPATDKGEYIVVVYRDVTPYKEAQEKAEQANKAKSQFLANMSHELRTPLNAVIGYSEMIREDVKDRKALDEDQQDQLIADLEQIHTAGEQLLSMVNDVLDISKIEAGEMELHTSRFDVCAMIEETEATIRPLVEDGDNEFTVECPDDVGSMHTDRTKLRQSLFNLLGNAAKFTEGGRVTLHVRREEVGGKEGFAFAVEDTGVGMSEDEKAEVFEAFQQADTSLTREHEGTGLGLVITRNFCQLMGGDVSVESEEGAGSTFTMHLPAEVEDAPEAKEPQEQKEGASLEEKTGETPAAEASSEHRGPVPAAEADFDSENVVLVIDDDQRARDLIGRQLQREGFDVVAAASGDEGLETARALQPTAITLDVMMPEKDGWAVLSALKNEEELKDIPVVMVTIVDEEEMGYMLGAADYLTKPLNAERLVGVLRKYRSGEGACSVMVVEDDETTRDLMRRTLEKQEGCAIYEAENGRVALEELHDSRPDMILLDLMMPEMDGFTFLDKMHEHEEYWSIPVVVVTAKELTAEDRERLNEHVETVLQKGDYDREELLRTVSNRVKAMTGGA